MPDLLYSTHSISGNYVQSSVCILHRNHSERFLFKMSQLVILVVGNIISVLILFLLLVIIKFSDKSKQFGSIIVNDLF